jgi:hypothetical protein
VYLGEFGSTPGARKKFFMKHLGEKNTLGTKEKKFQTPGGPGGEKIFFLKRPWA